MNPHPDIITVFSIPQVMSEERVIGTVTTEIKVDSESGQETQGRISYENRGECFFLPFTMPDVEGNVTLASGDKVSFQVKRVLSVTPDNSSLNYFHRYTRIQCQ